MIRFLLLAMLLQAPAYAGGGSRILIPAARQRVQEACYLAHNPLRMRIGIEVSGIIELTEKLNTFHKNISCPLRTKEALLALRNSVVSALLARIEHSDGDYYRALEAQLDSCRAQIEAHGLGEEFANLTRYAKHRANMGLMPAETEEATEAYLKSLPAFAKEIPLGLKKLPRAKWKEAVLAAGRPWIEKLEFKNIDSRDVTYVEKENYTQFMLTDDNFAALVTLETKDAEGKALIPPKIYFVEYHYKDEGGTRYVHAQDGGISRCYSCHPSGLRKLAPTPGDVLPSQWKDVAMFNKTVDALGTYVDWHGAYKPLLFGPQLGEKHGCTGCHDGIQRGDLNSAIQNQAFTSSQIAYKVAHELAMPGHPARIQPLFDKIARMEGLSDDEVQEFRKIRGSDKALRYELAAKFMHEKQKLSAEDLAVFEEYIKTLIPKNTAIVKEIFTTYQNDLKKWLLGTEK